MEQPSTGIYTMRDGTDFGDEFANATYFLQPTGYQDSDATLAAGANGQGSSSDDADHGGLGQVSTSLHSVNGFRWEN